MGGFSYDRDVYGSGSSCSSSGFHASIRSRQSLSRDGLCNLVLPSRQRGMSCDAQTGVVIGVDGTGSMGDAAFVLHDKLPMFWGQIEQQGYLKDFALSFAMVGDVNSDHAPLQICPFAKGAALDEWIGRLYIEGNGGGQGMESYETLAYFYARHVDFTHPKAHKPYLFLIGDESYYPEVPAGAVRDLIGDRLKTSLSAAQIFGELMEKYQVYMLHVRYNGGDKAVCKDWKKILGQNFILLKEPKAVVDVVLGIIALTAETRDLDGYLTDMRGRGQTAARIENVREALSEVGTSLIKVDASLPALPPLKRRGGRSRRL